MVRSVVDATLRASSARACRQGARLAARHFYLVPGRGPPYFPSSPTSTPTYVVVPEGLIADMQDRRLGFPQAASMFHAPRSTEVDGRLSG